MDFEMPAAVRDLQRRARELIAEEIIPLENDARCTVHGPDESLRRELVAKGRPARAARVARAAQKERRIEPLAAGEIRRASA